MDAQTRPILVIGIDEAGYGPVLGPLVVSAVALEVSREAADVCLWKTLRRCVSKTINARGGRLPILDSKKLYQRKEGLSRLEQSALAIVSAAHGFPPDARSLLSVLGPDAAPELERHPWYSGANPALPTQADAGAVRISAARLVEEGARCGARFVGCASEVMPEGHFNRQVERTQNKAVVSLGLVLRLVQRMADARPDHELRIYIDRQGGREYYGPVLMRSFDDRRLRILLETDDDSAYEMAPMAGGGGAWSFRFTTRGDSRHLSIAAASLVAKYVRELLMGAFNAWWLREVPDVRPTAGYYGDGWRFLRDIEPAMRRLGIPREMLVRDR